MYRCVYIYIYIYISGKKGGSGRGGRHLSNATFVEMRPLICFLRHYCLMRPIEFAASFTTLEEKPVLDKQS